MKAAGTNIGRSPLTWLLLTGPAGCCAWLVHAAGAAHAAGRVSHPLYSLSCLRLTRKHGKVQGPRVVKRRDYPGDPPAQCFQAGSSFRSILRVVKTERRVS